MRSNTPPHRRRRRPRSNKSPRRSRSAGAGCQSKGRSPGAGSPGPRRKRRPASRPASGSRRQGSRRRGRSPRGSPPRRRGGRNRSPSFQQPRCSRSRSRGCRRSRGRANGGGGASPRRDVFAGGRGGPREEKPDGCQTIWMGWTEEKPAEEEVKEFFADCGNVIEVNISDSHVRGYFAHVKFDDSIAVDNAMTKQGHDYRGRRIQLDYALMDKARANPASQAQAPGRILRCKPKSAKPPNGHTLWLGDIAVDCTEQDVIDFFEPCGAIEMICLKVNQLKNGQFGHAKFFDTEAVDKAVELAGTLIKGVPIRMDYAEDKPNEAYRSGKEKSVAGVVNRPQDCRTIWVGGLPTDVTEEMIGRMFERCGPIIEVRLDSSKRSGSQFCHVEFMDGPSADRAMQLSGETLGGSRIRVDFAENRKHAPGGKSMAPMPPPGMMPPHMMHPGMMHMPPPHMMPMPPPGWMPPPGMGPPPGWMGPPPGMGPPGEPPQGWPKAGPPPPGPPPPPGDADSDQENGASGEAAPPPPGGEWGKAGPPPADWGKGGPPPADWGKGGPPPADWGKGGPPPPGMGDWPNGKGGPPPGVPPPPGHHFHPPPWGWGPPPPGFPGGGPPGWPPAPGPDGAWRHGPPPSGYGPGPGPSPGPPGHPDAGGPGPTQAPKGKGRGSYSYSYSYTPSPSRSPKRG